MAIRTNTVVVGHGDINAIDGATALSYVATFRRVGGGNLPGLTKGNLFLLYSPDANDVSGGESAVWEYRSTDNGITTDVDYRIAAVYDGSLAAANRWKMWVDEVAKALSGSTPGATFPSSASVLESGKNTTSATDGYIADLKMWSVALTADQIIMESRTWRPQTKAGLILWAPYANKDDLKDYSGAANHGVSASATTVQARQLGLGGSVAVL